MTDRTPVHRLQVATTLYRFINEQVLPGTAVEPAAFWQGVNALVHELAPKNAALLAERERLQGEIDAWHRAHPGPITEPRAYRAFLRRIGYLAPVPRHVKVTTTNVDAEVARQAGPQLVVPITNARYALNAANARWGSLYDALYGTDVIPEAVQFGGHLQAVEVGAGCHGESPWGRCNLMSRKTPARHAGWRRCIPAGCPVPRMEAGSD